MRNYRGYLLTVLALALAFSYVDRLALGLLLQDIKVDLGLSDTQLGLLTGIAFAFFYSLMGIPIARYADRANRVAVIAITTALCGVMVSLCGAAGSFLQLLLIRIGVAVGEAGCMPAAHSLIASCFTRAERPRAVAIYMLGKPLSVVIGFILAGWLNELYGWRVTFMVLGLPGLGLAVLVWFTLREPRSSRSGGAASTFARMPTSLYQPEAASFSSAQPNFKDVLVHLWANVTFRHLLLCYSVLLFFSFGMSKWLPAFFIRSHGLSTGELGAWFAVIWGGGGLLGTYLGGELASRRAANNECLQLKAMAAVYSGFGFISTGIYLSPNYYLAVGLMGFAAVGTATANGPLFATIQSLVPDRFRATSIAIMYLFGNLIGMGLGPLAVGVLSDLFRPWVGQESLRYALLAMCPGFLWCSWYLWKGSGTVTRDLEAVQFVERRALQGAASCPDALARGVNEVNSLADR